MELRVLAILCAAGSLAAQSVPDPWGDITGRVRDHQGAPVVGASVRLEARTRPPHAFEVVAEALSRGRPLPEVKSTRDGSFVLPVLVELRETSMLGLEWTLVVQKAGYDDWHEHLPNGLYGYLGSEVVLRPATEDDTEDEVEFIAEGAPAGSSVVVGAPFVTHTITLDANGRARARLPRVPCPLQPRRGLVRGLLWTVASCIPGWASPFILERPVHRLTRADATVATPVARVDDQPATGVRALALCGGQGTWLDLPQARWPGQTLPLAFIADGCRMAREPRLQPLPPRPPRYVRIVDPDGQPIAHARAWLLAAEHWCPRRQQPTEFFVPPGITGGARAHWRRPRRVAADGVLSLGEGSPADRPAVLRIAAEGFEITDVLDPRGLTEDAPVQLARRASVTLVVRVTDASGAAIVGANVWLSDAADAPASWLGEKLVTGDDGTVTAAGLLPGECTVFAVKRGYLGQFVASHHKAGMTVQATCVLAAGEQHAFVVRDAVTRTPIPFADLVCVYEGALPPRLRGTGTAQDPHRLHADAAGRLVIPAAPQPSFSDGHGHGRYATRDGGGGWDDIEAARPEVVWVVPTAGMAGVGVAVKHASFTEGGSGGVDGALAFVPPDAACEATLAPAGTVTLAPTDAARLPRDPRTGVRRWVVGTASLAVEFATPCEQPELLWGVSGDGTSLRFAKETAVVFRGVANTWLCSDLSVRRLVFLHPKYAPLVVALTKAQRDGMEPLRLALQPGSPLLVDAVRGGPGAHRVQIEVRGPLLSGWVIAYESHLVFAKGFPAQMQPQSPLALPALAAGEWEVTCDAGLFGFSGGPGRTAKWKKTIQADGVNPIEVAEDAK